MTVGETYYYEVTAVDFSGEGALSAEVSLVATDSGPQVVGVYVSGSAWSTAKPLTDLFGALAAAGAGNTLGYELATGAGQLSDANIPGWVNLDTISLVFSEPVSGVSASSLSLGDSSNNGGPSSGITVASENNPSSTVATFTLSGPLTSNKYFLDLAAAGITDAAGTPLDGAWTQGVSTFAAGSGDGSPASDFVYRFDVLAGDVIGDGTVSAADVDVERSQPLSLTDTSTNWRDRHQRGRRGQRRRREHHTFATPGGDRRLPGSGPARRQRRAGGAGALGSSGGITVTSGTLIVTDPSEMPAGTHLAVGAGASLLFGPSAGSTSPAATAGPSAIASPIASAAASALPAATSEVGGPRSEAGGLTSDLRLPTSEPGLRPTQFTAALRRRLPWRAGTRRRPSGSAGTWPGGWCRTSIRRRAGDSSPGRRVCPLRPLRPRSPTRKRGKCVQECRHRSPRLRVGLLCPTRPSELSA